MPAEKRKRSPSPERFDTLAKGARLEPLTWEEGQKQMAEAQAWMDKRIAEIQAQEKSKEKDQEKTEYEKKVEDQKKAEYQKNLEELKKIPGLSTLSLGLHPWFPNSTVRDRRT